MWGCPCSLCKLSGMVRRTVEHYQCEAARVYYVNSREWSDVQVGRTSDYCHLWGSLRLAPMTKGYGLDFFTVRCHFSPTGARIMDLPLSSFLSYWCQFVVAQWLPYISTGIVLISQWLDWLKRCFSNCSSFVILCNSQTKHS